MKQRIALAVVVLACATPATADNLIDVYRQAQLSDPQWGAARAAYAANVERVTQGRALLLPAVDFGASRSQTDQRVKTPMIDDTFHYRTDVYSLQLTQPIYRKQGFALYAQGQALAVQAEADLAGARQELILRVAQSYLGALSAQDALDFVRAEKSNIERLLSLSQRNFAVGTAKLVDVHEAQAAYDLAVAQEIAAANEYEVRREALRLLTGTAPGNFARLGPMLTLAAPEPADMEKWVVAGADQPQLRSQEQVVESARQEIERNIGGHYPTLDLAASHVYNNAGSSVQGIPIYTNTNQIGLVFQLPLYRGGAVSSQVREAAARRDAAEQQLEAVRRLGAQQTRETYLAVVNGVARVRALEQAQTSNQRALESTLLGYERGLRTNIDVINAQRQLYRTRRDLSQARYDYLFARLRLKAVVGQLGDADLEDMNRLFTIY